MVKHVSLGELLTKWWKLPDDVAFVETFHMEFDEIMAILEIECPDAHLLNIQTDKVEISSRGIVWITFTTRRGGLH